MSSQYTKAPSGTFFEVLCLLRKTRELCPIAAAIKYPYPKASMQRGYPKRNILLYIILYFNVDGMYSFSPRIRTAYNNIIYYIIPFISIISDGCPRVIFLSRARPCAVVFRLYTFGKVYIVYCMFTIHTTYPRLSPIIELLHGSRNDAFYLHHIYIYIPIKGTSSGV